MLPAKSKVLLRSTALCAFLAGLAAAPTAFAQDDTTSAATATTSTGVTGEVVEDEGLVITGSRIRRSEFVTPSPVQILTTRESKLKGLIDPTAILQQSTVAAGSVQLNNQFSGFVVDGGQGINSISLRGLGAQRTLILLNGRRLNPAGVSGTVAAVDMNVIPTSMVDRYEILKDGASSIYGSDAVAGTINIITRDDMDGGVIDGSASFPIAGAGDIFNLSLSGGVVRDRWHLMGGVEYYEQARIKLKDRSWASCPRELQHVTGLPGNGFGRSYADGSPYCDFTQTDFVADAVTGDLYIYDPTQPASYPYVPFDADPFPGAPPTGPRLTNIATTPEEREVDLVAPVKRLSFTAIGSFDINGSNELYFEGLLTNRHSQQDAYVPSFFPSTIDDIITTTFNPFNPIPSYVQPVITTPVAKFGQDIWAGRAVIGVKGDLGFLPKWNYDVGVTYGKSSADYFTTPRLTSRVYNALDAVEAPAGFDPTLVRNNPVDGLDYTCAINLTNPAERCYPLNWFTSAAEFVNDPTLAYITTRDKGHTEYEQVIFNAYIDGPLFNLPAGPLSAVFGVEYRYDKLNDTPGAEAVARNYYGQSTSGITKGDEDVKEVFVEFEAPLIKAVPFVESLTLNLSDRYTSYKTAGSDNTYKLGLNWQIVPSFRARSTYGTSFRGPALFENYLAEQLAFTSAADPCERYGDNNSPGDPLYENCASEGLAPNFAGFDSTPEIYSIGALGRLDPETSTNWTAGIIWQPSFMDLNISIDYFNITVENEIAQLGGPSILSLCYTSVEFRSGSPYCTLVSERDAFGNIDRIDDSYLNISEQRTEGWDVHVRYIHEFPAGDLQLDWEATYTTVDKAELIEGYGFDNFNGTFGDPKVVWGAEAKFTHKDWEFLWAADYVGYTQVYDYYGFTRMDEVSGTPPREGRYKMHTEPTIVHAASVTYNADKWTGTLGVRNLFDEYPPSISSNATWPRQGTAPGYTGQYDYFGRTVFINFSKDF